eukprot:scaffold474_cov169-Ochromonas_danica.AAC.14
MEEKRFCCDDDQEQLTTISRTPQSVNYGSISGSTSTIRLMKEDKKTDPEVLARQENLLIEVDNKKAVAIVSMARLRAMNFVPLAGFKEGEKFNAMAAYKTVLESQRPSTAKSKK